MGDMNAVDVEGAMQMVMGSARVPWALKLWRANLMAKISKKLKAAYAAVDRNKAYELSEAVALGQR